MLLPGHFCHSRDGLAYAPAADILKAWIDRHWEEWYEGPIIELENRASLAPPYSRPAWIARYLHRGIAQARPSRGSSSRSRSALRSQPLQVSIDGLGDADMKLFDAIDFLNRPASPQFVTGKLAQSRTAMARASESQNDIEIVIATYAEHIRQYPQDIVAYVIDRCIHTRKWFPLILELCAEMEGLASFRRAVRTAFEEARNPLLAGRVDVKRIAADPRLQMNFRELEKKDWLPIHWRWYIEDAEHMAQLSRRSTP